MPKRPIVRVESDRVPAGLTRGQRRAWMDDVIKRRQLATSNVADAADVAALLSAAVPVPTVGGAVPPVGQDKPAPSGLRARMWNRRPLLAAVVLISVLDLIVISTQIAYYRGLGAGLAPEFAGGDLRVRVYLAIPFVTEALSMFYALLAGYVINKNAGRYKLYLKLMWLFAGIAAVVNIKNNWNGADATHVTALLLGGLSLAVPLVWHSYAGMTIAVQHLGLTIADLAHISRGWIRHPRFSWTTARAVDLFPNMSRQQVWDMVVKNHREKLMNKWNTTPEQRREQRAQIKADAKAARAQSKADIKAARTVGAKVDMITNLDDIRRRFWNRFPIARREPAGDELFSGVNKSVHDDENCSPGLTSNVHTLDRPPVPPETRNETTGEIRAREQIIAAWFDVHGEHLSEPREQKWGYQTELANKHGVSKSFVSGVFKECRNGVHKNPFLSEQADAGE